MFLKLLVILAFISFGNVLADDGLLNSIFSDDDGEITAPKEVNDENEKKEVEGQMGDGKDDRNNETSAPEEEKTIESEQTDVSQEDNNDVKDNTNDSGWDCVAYSDNIVQCTSKKMVAAFARKVPSNGGAGIPTKPPKGVSKPQKDVHIKGPLEDWFNEFFGVISKIHDKVKESVQLPFKKILGD